MNQFRTSRELKFFVGAALALGMASSIIDATLNNFLNERFALSGFQRAFLELPREFPGIMVVFVSALLWFLCSRRLGATAMLLGAAGALLIGFASSSYAMVVVCLFIYSLGQHIFLPLQSSIGMELAEEGKSGRRLGQLNGVRNLAVVLGSTLVYLAFTRLHLSFQHTFVMAAALFAAAALLMFSMKPEETREPKTYLKLRREYRLYYLLAILYGARKQLFLTFAPWVIVTVFHQPTQTIATLLVIGGGIGILFQPLLGRAIDRLGERFVLGTEALVLVAVCFGNGFAKFLLPEQTAFLVVCACYLLDQILFSVNMARSTFMKKIALSAEDIQPAITSGVTLDHFFSIGVALLGGLIWNAYGFQYVFVMGMAIAGANFWAAMRVQVPLPGADSVHH